MTITVTKGDLLKENVDAIINTVNCVGVMGKGIALQFKQKWPENYKAYAKACKENQVHTGQMFVHPLGQFAGKPYFIINFPTKAHWRSPSKLEFIVDGLNDLVRVIRENKIKSIAMPPLGCGNGGLDWSIVRPLIEQAMSEVPDVEVHLFEPAGAPQASSMVVRTERPNMTPARAVFVKLMSAYRDVGYELSKIEVQKLGYFAHVAKVLPRLDYAKNRYGPYSHPLTKVLEVMNGHFITGLGDNDQSEAQIVVLDDAIQAADDVLKTDDNAIIALKEIEALIEGFETPLGMELLSTVHWASVNDARSSDLNAVTKAVYNWLPDAPKWSKRKRELMPERHIEIALKRLQSKGWVQ